MRAQVQDKRLKSFATSNQSTGKKRIMGTSEDDMHDPGSQWVWKLPPGIKRSHKNRSFVEVRHYRWKGDF